MSTVVFTIGHSTHPSDRFVELLRQHGVTAVGDVRSTPYSRFNPHFNTGRMKVWLPEAGIAYVFLGRELGARSDDPSCYEDGRVQYDRLATTELFRKGLERVREGSRNYTLALMCAEKEPLECHRTILVARHVAAMGFDVQHIHADGTLESHDAAMTRLVQMLDLPQGDMFRSRDEILAEAYERHGQRIAYRAVNSA